MSAHNSCWSQPDGAAWGIGPCGWRLASRRRCGVKILAVIFFASISNVLCAQVTLTPTNRGVLFLSGNTNTLSVSNAVRILSGLRTGMEQTNVDKYMNAHGMTNQGGLSLDRGRHSVYHYNFPGTDSTLVLETRSKRTGPGLFDWGNPILEGGRIQRLDVDTFLITFTNAP